MPAHDWSRVDDGAFHDFHTGWIGVLRTALNKGVLPPGYSARAEQHAGAMIADVLTLEPADANASPAGANGVATQAAPNVRFAAELASPAAKPRHIVIRHTTGRRVVAVIEIVSPGNKAKRDDFRTFVRKSARIIRAGVHLMVIDLQPPTPRDPRGIHAAIWSQLGGRRFTPPPGEPLTLASYAAGDPIRAYVEPLAAGRALPDMPLFLSPQRYVHVPLERTYFEAFDGLESEIVTALTGEPE